MEEDLGIIVSPVVRQLIGKLESVVDWKERNLIHGNLEADLAKLKQFLMVTTDVLDDAEARSVKDKAVSEWLKDLKDACYDADDVMDEFQFEAGRRRGRGRGRRRMVQVLEFFSSSSRNPFIFRCTMSHKIKQVVKRIDELAKLKANFHLNEIVRRQEMPSSHLLNETPSFIDEDCVFGRSADMEILGRSADMEILVKLLLSTGNDKDLSVLSIVGMGGVGKTTLAQLIYNDQRVKDHFELLLWVCVGDDFDVKSILRQVIAVAGPGEGNSIATLEEMHMRIHEKVLGKRFLLVLDDVWNEDYSRWQLFRSLLRGGRHGSKILVTTRSMRVAQIMDTGIVPYRVNPLSEDYSWKLFTNAAFGPGMITENPNLLDIGREIVKKCGGLPLAAKALGRILASKQTEEEWLSLRDSVIWQFYDRQEGILPALRLSYNYLPSYLKQCFAYFALFPEDCEINKSKLIQMWIAEGFIDVPGREVSAENTGDRFFNELLSRSFLHVTEIDEFGQIVSCKMHDLIHDLARYVVSRDFSFVVIDGSRKIDFHHNCLYYSKIIDPGPKKLFLNVPREAKKLRSLHLFTDARHPVVIDDLGSTSSSAFLRVLNINGIETGEQFLTSVGKLKLLRFLDLSYSLFEVLPDSIARLYCLQSLILKCCRELRELPQGIGNLSNLRHLDTSECDKLIKMPLWLGRLIQLQTLPLFIVGKEPGTTIAELQNLNLISGELKIKCLGNVEDPSEACAANLQEKTHIVSLQLEFESFHEEDLSSSTDENLLENLRPHQNLRHLSIRNYGGNRLPEWLWLMLPNLQKLQLNRFTRCESFMWLSSNLTSLKFLSLYDLPNLKEWFFPESGLLLLENLELVRCPKLRVQPHLPSKLTRLEIVKSNEEILAAGGGLHGLFRLQFIRIADITVSSTSSWWEGLKYLTALEELNISDCQHLDCLTEGVLLLPSLHILVLRDNHNLKSLEAARGSQKRPLFCESLHRLTIENCEELTELPNWIGDLTSLQSLEIKWCNKLAMIPDGLRQLTRLLQLTLVGCPLLDRRCEQTGEDWHKIAHIPNVFIGQTSDAQDVEQE